MKVRATQTGYYAHKRKYEGDEFILEPIKRIRKDKDDKPREITIMPEQQFSDRWMERVEGPAPKKAKLKKVKKTKAPEEEAGEPVASEGL